MIMKSFIWRLRSNYLFFLVAIALFTVIYIIMGYSSIEYHPYRHEVSVLSYADPMILSAFVCFAFFLICSKRYTYDEEHLYGNTSKLAICSSLLASFIYVVMFSCYALGLSLLVRRGILSVDRLAVSKDLYDLSALEIFQSFASLIIINTIAYEVANILRKFRSWKFWVTLVSCAIIFYVSMGAVLTLPQKHLSYWELYFALTSIALVIVTVGDILMTKGRQYR